MGTITRTIANKSRSEERWMVPAQDHREVVLSGKNHLDMPTNRRDMRRILLFHKVLRWETNVNRLNINSASALHLISTQRSDCPEKFRLLGEVFLSFAITELVHYKQYFLPNFIVCVILLTTIALMLLRYLYLAA